MVDDTWNKAKLSKGKGSATKLGWNCKEESENRVSTVVTLIKPFRRHFLMHSAKIIIRKKKVLLTIAKMTNQLAKQKIE